MQRLVLASGNAGKLREFSRLLAPLGLQVVPQGEVGVGAADEPHHTFVENALAKARHAAAATGLPALADDSGLCCEALQGLPGVRSARFAGDQADDAANNALLVERLRSCADRRARYVCVLVALRSACDPEPLVAAASWAGEIVLEGRGQGGFGYDPHFLLPDLGLTAAELPADRKNAVSHRGLASRDLLAQITARWLPPAAFISS